MASTPPFDPSHIDRFLSGEASDVERAQVQAWAAADPRHHAFLESLRTRFAATSHDAATDTAWRALRAAMDVPGDALSLNAKRQRAVTRLSPQRSWRVPLRIAASLLLVAGSAAGWQWRNSVEDSFNAPSGATRVATLSDGTRVTLSPGSRARWRRNFGRGDREVYLDGEGYFEVVHDTLHPFRVRARDAVVEDVGTRFVVRAWPELARPEVAVEEGIVLLADSVGTSRGVALTAGQSGRLESDGRVTVAAIPNGAFTWIRGELIFDNAPLSVALPSLSRWYDVDLRADSSLAGRHLSARLVQQPLPQLLDALALALDARVARNGRVLTLARRTQ
ncbi:MAG: FecR domain-containing protein [Phycisphaerae bacterium]|nr:FecR domain-containing protein [Gemmatimonadaceae bacterium]